MNPIKIRAFFAFFGVIPGLACLLWPGARLTANLVQAPAATAPNPTSPEELKKLLQARYDGQIVVSMVSGLYAGEQEKSLILGLGKGDNAMLWNHYHDSIAIPKRIPSSTKDFLGKKPSDLHQLDERTFGGLSQGLNVSQIEKGESLKVRKLYGHDRDVEFVLSTTSLGHLRDIDMQKASTRTSTRVSGGEVRQQTSVEGFGMIFRFYFDKDRVMKAANYAAVVGEIDKYFLPQQEAKAAVAAEKNIEIDPGLSEEEVIKRLGQPLRAIRVGNRKSLKYQEMTVILTDGKVTEVKLD